jgi:hypothetical protein
LTDEVASAGFAVPVKDILRNKNYGECVVERGIGVEWECGVVVQRLGSPVTCSCGCGQFKFGANVILFREVPSPITRLHVIRQDGEYCFMRQQHCLRVLFAIGKLQLLVSILLVTV